MLVFSATTRQPSTKDPATYARPIYIWYRTTRTSPYCRIMFSKRYLCFVYKYLICTKYVVVRRFLRRQTIATIRDFWMFRPWSVRAVGRGRGDVKLCSLLRLSQVIKKGYVFGQVGGNGGQSGVDKSSRFAGSYPRHFWSKGGSFCPLNRRGPVRLKNVLQKKNGARARHGL